MSYISLEDAIKAIHDDWDKLGVCVYEGGTIADDVEETLLALPAADVVERPRWTPCKDRMPKVDGMYRFCTLNGETHVWHSSTVKYSLELKLFKPTMPIAWMPLSESYKEG